MHSTMTWTVPTVSPARRDSPWMKTVKVSVPSSDRRNSVTPRCAMVSPARRTRSALAQSAALRPDVSEANFSFFYTYIYFPPSHAKLSLSII